MGTFIIECDKCGKEFEYEKILSLEHTKMDKLKISYFSCPYCGYKYVVMIEDSQQARYTKQIQNLQLVIRLKHSKGKEISQAKLNKLKRLLEESKSYQATLRETYITAVTDQLNKSE